MDHGFISRAGDYYNKGRINSAVKSRQWEQVNINKSITFQKETIQTSEMKKGKTWKVK